MAHVGVDPVGEVDRRGSAREGVDRALRREGVDLVGVEVHLERREELAGVRDVPGRLEDLPDRRDPLFVDAAAPAPLLVLPVGRDPLLGEEVHLARPDLDLERGLTLRDHRRVEGLVEVLLRHRDVVLDPARDRPPGLVDDAEGAVAVAQRVDEDAEGEDVVELVERDRLADELLADRPEPLHPPAHLGGNPGLRQLPGDVVPELLDGGPGGLHPLVHRVREGRELVRVEVAEGEVLELALDPAHPETVRQRRVDLHRLGRDGAPLLLPEVAQGPHVVEAVGQLDEDDPQVARHREEHLPERLGLLRLLGRVGVPADLRDAVDDVGDLLAEEDGELLLRRLGVLEDVVEEARGHGNLVELQLGQEHRHADGVDEVRLPGGTELVPVRLGREDVRAPQEVLVRPRQIALDRVEDVLEPQHGRIMAAPVSGARRERFG